MCQYRTATLAPSACLTYVQPSFCLIPLLLTSSIKPTGFIIHQPNLSARLSDLRTRSNRVSRLANLAASLTFDHPQRSCLHSISPAALQSRNAPSGPLRASKRLILIASLKSLRSKLSACPYSGFRLACLAARCLLASSLLSAPILWRNRQHMDGS